MGGLNFFALSWRRQQGFLYWGDGGSPSPTGQIFTYPSPPPGKVPPSRLLPPKELECYNPIKTSFLAAVIAILPSYLFYTQVMLILILINIHYSQNVVFSFEKGSIDQNHSFSDFHHPIQKSHPGKFSIPPTP